jgi:hypothetical protein
VVVVCVCWLRVFSVSCFSISGFYRRERPGAVLGIMASANLDLRPHGTDDSIQAIELTTLPDPSLAAASVAVIVASKGSLESSRGRSIEAGCEVKHTCSAEGVETQIVNGGSNEAETKQRSTWRLVTIMIALFVSADSVYCGWQNRTSFRC